MGNPGTVAAPPSRESKARPERSPERPAEPPSPRPPPASIRAKGLGLSKIRAACGLSLVRRRVWAGFPGRSRGGGGTTQGPPRKACLDPGFLSWGLPILCARALGSLALHLLQRAQPRCGRSSNLSAPQLLSSTMGTSLGFVISGSGEDV